MKTTATAAFFSAAAFLFVVDSSYCQASSAAILHNNRLIRSFTNIMGQTISSTQFFLYGKRHFTKTGYLRHVKQYYTEPVQSVAIVGGNKEDSDGVDLSGKVFVVTGANSGMGYEVTSYVAGKKARVYMICRSAERANKAKEAIQKASGNDDVHVILADVGELQQVRDAAKTLASKEKEIHGVVCNAGVLLNEQQRTSEDNEMTFACHLLGGSYLLPQLLLPQLRAAASDSYKPRCITVTSGGMYNFKLPSWDNLTSAPTATVPYDGVNVYAYAKRGQVLLAERLATQIPEIDWITVHPGWADTPAVDDAFGSMKKYLEPLRDPWEGAEGTTWLLSTTNQLENGALYLDRKVQTKHIAGPFFSEGSYTKNTPEEVDEFMKHLKQAAGLE